MKFTEKGMTLLELTVVLLVLIALASLAIPYVSGTSRMAPCQTTDATLQAVKKAIMGGSIGAGFYSNTLGYYPKATKSTTADFNLFYLLTNPGTPPAWNNYNPKTGVGWNGPYLAGGIVPDSRIDSSFASVIGEVYNPATNTSGKVHTIINNSTNQQTMDAWFRPIVIQVPYDTVSSTYQLDNARIVSAGLGLGMKAGDATINTAIHNNPTASDRGDDRVLFLFKPDPFPAGNLPCVEFD